MAKYLLSILCICIAMGVNYKEYLLRGDQAIYMAFIDWIAAVARQKGR